MRRASPRGGSGGTPPAAAGSGGGRRIVVGAHAAAGRPDVWSTALAEHSDPDAAGTRPVPDDAVAAAGRPRTGLLLTLAATVLVLDLVTKLLVVATIDEGENIRLLGGALYLTLWRNTGAAFSFAEGMTVVFTLIAATVAVVIVRSARRMRSTPWAIALGLVLGGAVGNLVDRVFRAPGFLQGGVVDFVSVFAPNGEFFPVFNVADSAIVCGGILGALLAVLGVEFDGTRTRTKADAGTDEDGGAARG
ncbi:signal peptidase II [Blastococcus sp. SYSU D00669]